MRSNRRRFLFVALLTAIMWYWHLTFTKIDPNLTHLAFSPTRENLSDAKLFVHQKEIVRTNLGRRKAESSNERLVDPKNWLKPNVLLKDDMEKARERPACLIPQIDPFHDLAMKEMRDVGMINCSRDGFGFVADGQLILKASKLRFAQIQYIQRPAGDDDEYILSEPTQLIEPNKGVAQPGILFNSSSFLLGLSHFFSFFIHLQSSFLFILNSLFHFILYSSPIFIPLHS